MVTLAQTVPSFKVAATEERLTVNAGFCRRCPSKGTAVLQGRRLG